MNIFLISSFHSFTYLLIEFQFFGSAEVFFFYPRKITIVILNKCYITVKTITFNNHISITLNENRDKKLYLLLYENTNSSYLCLIFFSTQINSTGIIVLEN
jgi:hypothetical protein